MDDGAYCRWQQVWDMESDQHYYFNASTGESVWREPAEGYRPAVCFVGETMVDVLATIIKLQAVARCVFCCCFMV